ncbi:cilia- and flagella-associated protein 57 [Alca torda]
MAVVRLQAPGSGICQVSFSPEDNAQVCVTGNGFFKLFKYSEGTLKQTNLQKGEPQNYLCHAWLSKEEVICGTDTGKLILFETGELHWETTVEYKKSPRELEEDAISKVYGSFSDISCGLACEDNASQQDSLPQISAVAAYSKGFACSSSPGVVLLFEKTKEKEVYKESQEIWIHAVKWSTDDAEFFSCDTHGAVYEWNLLTGKRKSECVLKSCMYSSIALSSDAKIIFAVGSDETIKEISESSIQHEVSAFGVVYTAIAVSHSGHMVFVGTSLGTIRAMKYPLPLTKEFNEYQAHAGAVTKMSITNDDLFLLTASEDGSVFIWKVYDKGGGILKWEKEVEYAEEVLIMRSDIEEKSQAMLDLQIRVKELQTEKDYQLCLKDIYCNEKIKELEENFTQEIGSLKTKHQAEKEKQELQHQFELSELMNKQAREMQQLESDSNQKLLTENEKYQELEVKSQRMQEEYEKQLHNLEESKSRTVKELTEYYEEKLNEKSVQLEELNSLQKELKERNRDIEEMRLEQQKLQGIIKSLEKDILALKTEIQERADTIQDKEKHIYDLKKKNQELEKFKFVLDYRIEEFKKQIESRENDIETTKEQIREMEGELERFRKESTQLKLNISQLQQKLKATDREMHRERQKKQNMEALIKRFKTDLHNCVGFIQDSKKMKDGIRELYSKYVQQSDMVETDAVDTDLQQEYMRQREYLERNLAALKKKVVKDQEIHQAAYVRIMQENVSLIKEINALRQELKVAHTQVNDLRSTLRLTKKKQAIQDTAPSSDLLSSPAVLRLNAEKENETIIEMQQLEIQYLRDQIQQKGQVLAVQPLLDSSLPQLNLERSHKTQQQ